MGGKRRNLPEMRCDKGCHRCCGIVLVTESDFKRVIQFAEQKGIKSLKQGSVCPWCQNGRCAVYSVRPMICRLFGHVDDPAMTCMLGYNVNISAKLVQRLLAKQVNANRLLHEVLPEWKSCLVGFVPANTKTIDLGVGRHKRTITL